jgi:hypothetical protein
MLIRHGGGGTRAATMRQGASRVFCSAPAGRRFHLGRGGLSADFADGRRLEEGSGFGVPHLLRCLNLYQSVKGLSAGARIVKPGGLLIIATECREGVPAGSPCDTLLRGATGPEEMLAKIEMPGFRFPEQWQPQIQALIQRKAEVLFFSSLPEETLRAVHLSPCRDIGATVRERLAKLGPDARVAVLPHGPLTVPYIES